ncbi:hypothetical protein V1509DRAFT_636026 [Lipomyces kononenkoae]
MEKGCFATKTFFERPTRRPNPPDHNLLLLCRGLRQVVNSVTFSVRMGQVELPIEPLSFPLLDNSDKELYELFKLPKCHGMIERLRLWRITAFIFISAVCCLHQMDPLVVSELPSLLLLDGLQETVDDYTLINVAFVWPVTIIVTPRLPSLLVATTRSC